jgi:hypothetical protein
MGTIARSPTPQLSQRVDSRATRASKNLPAALANVYLALY